MNTRKFDLITILGPTASGKTGFAARLAHDLSTEIISGDSRQVYRRMDIGTGKDLSDYTVDGCPIAYHLIDIAEPGEHYNIYRYQHDFLQVYETMRQRQLVPIVCGGSGLYVESVLRGYKLYDVPENPELRQRLSGFQLGELTEMLKTYKTLHNSTDVDTVQRAIRAIEIEEYYKDLPADIRDFPPLRSLNICFDLDRDVRRARISQRLKARLNEGMVDEVKGLLDEGLQPEQLIYYGLEYKFLTQYIIGQLSFDEMYHSLEIAIHQFAKRQMTWFRGMERRGIKLHWLDATLPYESKAEFVHRLINEE